MGWLAVQDEERAALVARHAREFERVHRLITAELRKAEGVQLAARKRNSRAVLRASRFDRISAVPRSAACDSGLLRRRSNVSSCLCMGKTAETWNIDLARSSNGVGGMAMQQPGQRASSEIRASTLVSHGYWSWPPLAGTRRSVHLQRCSAYPPGLSRSHLSLSPTSSDLSSRPSADSFDRATFCCQSTDRRRDHIPHTCERTARTLEEAKLEKGENVKQSPRKCKTRSQGKINSSERRMAATAARRTLGEQDRVVPQIVQRSSGKRVMAEDRSWSMPSSDMSVYTKSAEENVSRCEYIRAMKGDGIGRSRWFRRNDPLIEDVDNDCISFEASCDQIGDVEGSTWAEPAALSHAPSVRREEHEGVRSEGLGNTGKRSRGRGRLDVGAREGRSLGTQRRKDGHDLYRWDAEHDEEQIREVEVIHEGDPHDRIAVKWSRTRGESWLRMRDPVSQRDFWFNPETRAAEWEDGQAMDTAEGMGLGLLSEEERDRLRHKFERRQRRRARTLKTVGHAGRQQQSNLREHVLRKLTLESDNGVGELVAGSSRR